MSRQTFTSRDVRAGCFVCHDVVAHWMGKNAQGVAARHTDATGHETWCEIVMNIRYEGKSGSSIKLKPEASDEPLPP